MAADTSRIQVTPSPQALASLRDAALQRAPDDTGSGVEGLFRQTFDSQREQWAAARDSRQQDQAPSSAPVAERKPVAARRQDSAARRDTASQDAQAGQSTPQRKATVPARADKGQQAVRHQVRRDRGAEAPEQRPEEAPVGQKTDARVQASCSRTPATTSSAEASATDSGSVEAVPMASAELPAVQAETVILTDEMQAGVAEPVLLSDADSSIPTADAMTRSLETAPVEVQTPQPEKAVAPLPWQPAPLEAAPVSGSVGDMLARLDAASLPTQGTLPVASTAVNPVLTDTIPAGSVPVGGPVAAVPVDAVPVDAVPVDAVPVDAVPVDAAPVVGDADVNVSVGRLLEQASIEFRDPATDQNQGVADMAEPQGPVTDASGQHAFFKANSLLASQMQVQWAAPGVQASDKPASSALIEAGTGQPTSSETETGARLMEAMPTGGEQAGQGNDQPDAHQQEQTRWALWQSQGNDTLGKIGREVESAFGRMSAARETKAVDGAVVTDVRSLLIQREVETRQLQSTSAVPAADPLVPGRAGFAQAMGERIMMLMTQKVTAADIVLDPRELGPVEVKIRQDKDQTTLIFASHHPAVREQLEASLPKLRDMFTQAGLSLGSVSVGDRQAGSDGGQQGQQRWQGADAQETTDAATPAAKSRKSRSEQAVDFYA